MSSSGFICTAQEAMLSTKTLATFDLSYGVILLRVNSDIKAVLSDTRKDDSFIHIKEFF